MISGAGGNDRISAGPGRDTIRVAGGGRDRGNCGPGIDRVTADRRDVVSSSCERVTRRRR